MYCRTDSGLSGRHSRQIAGGQYLGEGQLKDYYDRVHIDAGYVDSVLDTVGEERYQFLGTNGEVCYWLTEHLPQGPVFFQYPDMLRDEDSWFSKSFKEQLDKTNVILLDYDQFEGDALREYTLKLTEELPEGVQPPPEGFHYILLFRKNCSEFWADSPVLQPFDTSTLFSDPEMT